MRRWPFILAVVSLFLCLAVVALWVRSYVAEDSLGRIWPPQGMRYEVVSVYGGLWAKHGDDCYVGIVPYVFVVLLFGAASAVFFALNPLSKAMLTRSRRRRGLCGKCGYDLRASRDRCPECGTPVEENNAVAVPVQKPRTRPVLLSILLRLMIVSAVVALLDVLLEDRLLDLVGTPTDRWVKTAVAVVGILLACGRPVRRAWVEIRAERSCARGLCPKCTYDLRASHGRCPECGTAIPVAAEAKA